jgi:D-proline reductase (dithiol) PrdB
MIVSVDSFKFLPRIIAFYYQRTTRQPELPIPWTPLRKPLKDCQFGLVTSAGIYQSSEDPPFDLDREKREPTWGDPTFRRIPVNIKQKEIGVSHLHINPSDILEDFNILLPITHFKTLRSIGIIGGLSEYAYSFMGYQGFPPDTSDWEETFGPQVASELLEDDVDCVFLTPA